jgi:hypothetical protein
MHCVNNEQIMTHKNDSSYDKFVKVHWVFEGFVKNTHELYNLNKFCTYDEAIIAYHRHFSPINKYMLTKPMHNGIKVWAFICNPTKYIYNML